jgi:hypothetical protein
MTISLTMYLNFTWDMAAYKAVCTVTIRKPDRPVLANLILVRMSNGPVFE